MTENFEIERKFLVVLPDLDYLNVQRQLDILQIYLCNGENGSQRRVRCITENGVKSYFYTEKVFISAVVRQETEYEISASEYHKLILQKKADCVPIEKCRICFEFKEQIFELDVYPFSQKYAIMELELENEEQEIFFPEYINIVKEVTGINSYANSTLANAGKFPDE